MFPFERPQWKYNQNEIRIHGSPKVRTIDGKEKGKSAAHPALDLPTPECRE